jgi:hypothetical protein
MITSLKQFVEQAVPDEYGTRSLELALWHNDHEWRQAHDILADLADLTRMYSLNFHVRRSGVFTLVPRSNHEVRNASWGFQLGSEGVTVGNLWLSTQKASFIRVEYDDLSDSFTIKLEYGDDIEIELQLSSRYGEVENAKAYWGELVSQGA